MTTRKNPGLGARNRAITAAAAAGHGDSEPAAESAKMVGVGIRMPKAIHDDLRRISYEQRVSLNTLLVEGARMAIADRDKR